MCHSTRNQPKISQWLERALISPSFSRILAGQVISEIGSNATAVIIPLIAVITLQSSSFELGILNASESLAAALFGLFIGKWCDRIGSDKTMLASNLIGALATGILAIVLFTHHLSFIILIVLMLILGIASLGFDVSRTGYVVALVPQNRIPHANSLIEGANAVGEGIGPSIGGWLFNSVGSAVSLVVDFISYLVSSFLVFWNIHLNRQHLAHYDSEVREEEAKEDKKEAKADRKETEEDGTEAGQEDGTQVAGSQEKNSYLTGFRFVFSNGIIHSVALSAGQFNFFTAAFFTVYYIFVVRSLKMNPLQVGLADTFSGIAGILSAVTTGKIIKKLPSGPLYIASLILPALAGALVPISGAMSLTSTGATLLTCCAQFLWSFSVTVSVILGESIKQVVTPKNMLGQVSSAERMIAFIADPVGALVAGALSAPLGEQNMLYICVIGLASSVLWTIGRKGILSFTKPQEW